MWNPIETAPKDKNILLKQECGKSIPMIVIGEISTFKGKNVIFFNAAYEDTVRLFTGKDYIEPTEWAEI